MFRASALLLSFFAVAVLLAQPVPAQPRCSERTISATGTPSLFFFTGKRFARAAWSAKVRSELGEDYAKWGRARDSRLDCVRAQYRFVCSAAGRPCKAFKAGQ